MKIIRQLLRQPIKTFFGIILVSMAVAILCVCVGQSMAAGNMEASLDSSYHTVALLTGKYQYSEDEDGNQMFSRTIPESTQEWIREFLAENEEDILADSRAGLASAYIPSMTADNYTGYFIPPAEAESINYYLQSEVYGSPYTCAMLEVLLSEIGEPEETVTGVRMMLTGTVERVVSLQEGYADPTGFTVTLTLEADTMEKLEALDLAAGERYLAFGMDYYDKDWELRAQIAEEAYGISYHKDWADEASRKISGFQIDAFDMELMNYNKRPEYIIGVDENGQIIYANPEVWNQGYYTPTIVKEDGSTELKCVNLTNIDLEQRVRHVYLSVKGSDLVKLEGNAEELLSEKLEIARINDHAFAVLGVDNLNYIGPFSSKQAQISQGRDFTAGELESGAKVCIISSQAAKLSGLTVGDTIEVQYYSRDPDFQASISDGVGVVRPAAWFYTGARELAGPESCTIIGLYELDELWPDVNTSLYSVTPNTVFVPKTAVTGEMEYADQGVFRSIVLKNGTMDDFELQVIRAGQDGAFECYDQGYTEIVENLHDYKAVAGQALRVGLAVYGVVLLLFLILYPMRQGKALDTMGKLGAGRLRKFLHVNLSVLGILIPGSLAGLAVGIAMRRQVLDALVASADVVLPLQMDILSLLLVAGAQLLFAAAVIGAATLPLTGKKSLLNQQGRRISFAPLARLAEKSWVVAGFALIIALVLCGLHAANESEIENFEATRREIPVEISVQSLTGNRNNTEVEEWVCSLFTGQYGFGLHDYLTDIRLRSSMDIRRIDGAETESRLVGMTSTACAPELLPATDSHITWKDGYDESVFAEDRLVCLVPEGYTQEDTIELYFTYTVTKATEPSGDIYREKLEYEVTLTVAGTYVSTYLVDDIYVPYTVLDTAWKRLQISLNETRMMEYVGARIDDNTRLTEFRQAAGQYFAEPGSDNVPNTYLANYSLTIDDAALRKAENMLSNSITINRISTFLVFILSAGAGFFLGFLMIRSRKREIILMRTLGKPNWAIYWEFSVEQMLRLALGAAVGGAVFLWQPINRLGLFLLVYFAGLSGALILFLSSRLLTGVKEDE